MVDFEALYQKTKDLNILFVEDYIPLREKIVEILEDFFNIVVEANDGDEGLEQYVEFEKKHQKPFDIVITDIKMPRRNGIELTKAIQDIHEDQLIIVLSAHQESDYLLQFINLGIAQFIPKPVEPEKLLWVLDHVCKKIKIKEPESLNTDLITLDQNLMWHKKLHTLIHNDRHIELTKNELVVMKLLINNIEYICSVDTMIDFFLHEGIETNNESIRNMMSRLRKKLPEDVISNIYGLGYKLSRQYS
jgi:DNA-binding response OmpR family regulator